MLANFAAQAHIHSFLPQATDAAKNLDFYKRLFHDSDLPEDASAQWYAGLLYAYQYQVEEHRAYLKDCSKQSDHLDSHLEGAFGEYHDERYKNGNMIMASTEDLFRESMHYCAETNDLFEEMVQKSHDFFDRSDW